ncbi:MAG TPA: dihydroorotase family protein [Candidatus Limnocylindria bacterium]|nr:dihydroorotase family protein [Candidatus Limnocylindria bacterium]
MAEHFDQVIRGGTLVSGSGLQTADVAVRDGRIVAVEPPGRLVGRAEQEIDATGLHVLPGLIDGHVHFREPGLEHKEDWQSGSRAAVMGGVTTVLEMPNTLPPTADVAAVAHKRRLAAATSYCDFGLFGLLGTDNATEIRPMVESGHVIGVKAFLGPTTGELSPPTDDVLQAGLSVARGAGLRTCFHAEAAEVIARAEAALRAAGRTDALAHLESRPVEAEVAAIDRVGRLLSLTRAAGHILHLTSAEGLAAVERWRARSVDLSCEVSAHHCFLSAVDYARLGGLLKCNPPVREAAHGAALLTALADGRIDCIASDHAPHAPDDKRATDVWQAAAGIAGVETTLPLFLTAVSGGVMPVQRLVAAFAERPARIWGLWPRKGALAVGSDADLALVDLRRSGVIRGQSLHGKHGFTPFEGRPVQGAVVGTLVRGRLVAWQGELLTELGWGEPVSR